LPGDARGEVFVHGSIQGMSEQVLASLQADEPVDAVVACTRKEIRSRRSGARYLAVVLRDRSGSVEGRAWAAVQRLDRQFDAGDVVRVSGRTKPYLNQLQVHLDQIERVQADDAAWARLLPCSYRDLDELDGFLEHLGGEVHDRQLRALLDALLADELLRSRWRRAPCTLADHHAYLGGLLEHTVAVGALALEAAQQHPQLDSDLLLAAALVHDLGRTRELVYDRRLGLSEEGRLIGHIALGQQLIGERGRAWVGPERLAALLHCVGRHHGPIVDGHGYELPEALALARLNALDADVKGAYERRLAIATLAA
jgi:3'-5' exoribonuclease